MGVNRYWQGAALIVIKSELIVAGRALGVGQEQNRSPVRAGGNDVSSYAAPARAEDLTNLPPAYIDVGELDGLRDEAILYGLSLMRAGVPFEDCGCSLGGDHREHGVFLDQEPVGVAQRQRAAAPALADADADARRR